MISKLADNFGPNSPYELQTSLHLIKTGFEMLKTGFFCISKFR